MEDGTTPTPSTSVPPPGYGRARPKPKGVPPAQINLPPSDQTPYRLLADIQAKRVDPTTITANQRRALLVIMAHGKQTSAELGHFFGVSAKAIREDLRKVRAEFGSECRDWTPEEVVGQLAAYAERCTVGAMKNEDFGLVWTIQRDFAKTLKEMGMLQGVEEQGGIKITIEGLTARATTARKALFDALDPRLSGEVVDAEVVQRKPDGSREMPSLPLHSTRPDAPTQDPGVEIDVPELDTRLDLPDLQDRG